MADSSYEKGLTELSKMKVADLKIELKQRGLPTTGNKNELVERLQLAIHGDSALSLDETAEEILDEDAVLGVSGLEPCPFGKCSRCFASVAAGVASSRPSEEASCNVSETSGIFSKWTRLQPGNQQQDQRQDEEIEELSSKPDLQEVNGKRKLSTESNVSAKKIVLNRKPVIEEIKTEQTVKLDTDTKITEEITPSEKKIIKLSDLGIKERLEMRAKKFGLPLSEAARKEVRSARFSINNQNKSAASVNTPVPTTYDVLKKRAERFGTSVSTLMEKAELEARIEKRKARFGEVNSANEKVFPNKVKIVK